jgi:hypothetical protein
MSVTKQRHSIRQRSDASHQRLQRVARLPAGRSGMRRITAGGARLSPTCGS